MSQPTKPVRRDKAAHGRSAVSNRTRFFTEPTDERTIYARRYRSLVYDIAADAGGLATLSELRLALVRRAASIIIEIERLESRLAKGQEIDVDLLGRLTGHLRRLSETLGLDRVKRDVSPPTLQDIVAAHRAKEGAGHADLYDGADVAASSVSRTETPFPGDCETQKREAAE